MSGFPWIRCEMKLDWIFQCIIENSQSGKDPMDVALSSRD